ncbi:hypothetical protein Cha6605_1622 [Chamaesiphon minutus PCC 6605]|uniref:Uncharacterized protein n=1 Tax=Chamaesiphon minutus (strain ATCC 27169 / PCC 6605) TaxID=1173020 RepID=K9UCG5_CHAP6|nr:hypothetical protein Cha6605_1622 [Chamaesiphon minutus PCC 6605]
MIGLTINIQLLTPDLNANSDLDHAKNQNI